MSDTQPGPDAQTDSPDLVTEQVTSQVERRTVKQKLLRLALLVIVLIVVFGWFLPSVVGVDYASVWDTLRKLTFEEASGLFVLMVVWIVLEAAVSKTVLAGLPIKTAIMAWLGPNAVISSGAPPGTDIAIRYAMFRSRFTLEQAAAAAMVTGIVYILVKIFLVIPAGTMVFILERADQSIGSIMILSAGIIIAAIVVIALLVRWESFARWLGRALQSSVSWVLVRFKRGPIEGVEDKMTDIRGQVAESLGKRWPLVTGSILAAQIAMFLILWGSMRVTGNDAETLDWVFIFAAFAWTQFVTSVPIVPGNMGVAEAALTGTMVFFIGKEHADSVAAGVALYRTLTWLMPIPLGYIALAAFRRGERREKAIAAGLAANGG